MLGQLAPTSGEVEIGSRTETNYVDQNRLLLDDGKTVWEEVGEGSEYVRLGQENITLRGYLRRFLFSEERINTKINQLSGGERSRVLLAKILKRGGNVLILDEPTNDLDLGTLRLLEEALVAFGGSVIVVSHDRYFLNRVCTSVLAFEGEGALRYHPGNYDYYLEKRVVLGVGDSGAGKRDEAGIGDPGYMKTKRRKLKWKEERELEGMETAILTAEEDVARIEALFAEPDFYVTHAAELAELEAKLRRARDEVARLYTRWTELGEVAATSER
jgi:ATP-binding cassette subfamily F protein uup